MPEQRDVKVFISWSGDLSKEVAVALREWLPLLFDHVRPWASDTDIAPGQRGMNQIESELANTQFGIVVVTAANQHAAWLNFEAGALSRTVAEDVENRVVPLLVDLKSSNDLTGPLLQFQAKILDEHGLLLVLQSLGLVAGIPEYVVAKRFEVYWPQLEEQLEAAKEKASTSVKAAPPRRQQSEVLDEILGHVRALRSESERDESTPTAPKAGRKTITEFVEDRARALGFEVLTHERRGDGRHIDVAPLGDFSQEDADELERRLRKSIGGTVHFSARPF